MNSKFGFTLERSYSPAEAGLTLTLLHEQIAVLYSKVAGKFLSAMIFRSATKAGISGLFLMHFFV